MKTVFAFISLFFCTSIFAQRDTLPLNDGWQFSVDKKEEGLNNKWFEKTLSDSRTVHLPHTWNVEDENQNHYGWGWYQKRIQVPSHWKNKHVVLQFNAINHTSYIYVNGKKAAENIGDGFNKFFVSLDGKLNYGKSNIITVAVNNDYGTNKVPFGRSFDWPNDGGIIRPVAIIISGKPSVAYIHAEPKLNISDNSASLKIKLGFDKPANDNLQLKVTVTEENQPTKNVVLQTIAKPTWRNDEAVVDFNLSKINPWHFDFPNLYRIDVTVLKGMKAVDRVSTATGFRELKFVNGQTFLNGEIIKLMGVEWMAGSNPDHGLAEPDTALVRMGKLMKDVNCIFSRVHFQQDDAFLDFCDRNGILLEEELPLWGWDTPPNDSINAMATRQLERMISNHYNHPSIFGWGVGNELRGRDAKMKAIIEGLIARARQLDPARMVSYISNSLAQGFINDPKFVPDAGSFGDYLMMNEYGGTWWDIPVARVSDYIDSVHMSYPGKPLFISEFGLCEPDFKGGDERRIRDMIHHMSIYETKPYISGAIYFDLNDYRTHEPGTNEDNKYRRRIHGVYDMYGNPKASMKVLREMSSPVEIQGMSESGKGKLNILIFGHIGLPQHTVKGYKLYLSDKEGNYMETKAYNIPELKPGEKIYIEVDDLYAGKGIVTVVRPTGYIVSQKSFYWSESDK